MHHTARPRRCGAAIANWLASCWLALAAIGSDRAARADDWPQFRGPHSNSVAAESAGPARWDAEQMVAWKIELPGRGPSSPIVVGDRVLLTASSGNNQDRLHVLCFDVADGRRLWERQFWATGRTITHPQSANAAPTPASDGHAVFAFFSSNDLVALDLDGQLLWYRGLGFDHPRLGNDAGMASSPLVVDGTVIVQSESQGDSFATGIDARDGSTRWRNDRDRLASWTSPVVIADPPSGQKGLLVQSTGGLSCLEPITGKQRWSYKAACDGISSACFDNGVIFLPSSGIVALRPTPGAAEPEVLWQSNQLQPGAASPLVAGGKLYAVNRSGVLIAADVGTGEVAWRTRLEGSFWGTPAVCGNHLFACSYEGTGQVVDLAGDAGAARIVARIPLGEAVQASPAIAARAVFVRSDRHLWKLAAPVP
jgi:outer membrane protein assembly factor BamB